MAETSDGVGEHRKPIDHVVAFGGSDLDVVMELDLPVEVDAKPLNVSVRRHSVVVVENDVGVAVVSPTSRVMHDLSFGEIRVRCKPGALEPIFDFFIGVLKQDDSDIREKRGGCHTKISAINVHDGWGGKG